MTVRQKAIDFANRLELSHFDYVSIKQMLEKLGYAVLEYSDENRTVTAVLSGLEITFPERADAFSFFGKNEKYVFVRQTLSQEEKTAALATEAGNIVLGHFNGTTTLGIDSTKRLDAVSFAMILREICLQKGIKKWIIRHTAEAATAALTILLAVSLSITALVFYLSVDDGMMNPFEEISASSFDSALPDLFEIEFDNGTDDLINNGITDSITTDAEDAVTAFSHVNPSVETQTAQQTEEKTEIQHENVYYVTKSGNKYHTRDCSYIKDVSSCTEIDEAQIKSMEYEPCKRCIKQ